MSVVFTVLAVAAEEKTTWMVEFSATFVAAFAGTVLETENELLEGLPGLEGELGAPGVMRLLPHPARTAEKIAMEDAVRTEERYVRYMGPP